MKLMPGPLKAENLAPLDSVPAWQALLAEWQPVRDAMNAASTELRTLEREIAERHAESQEKTVARIAESLRAGDATGGMDNTIDKLLVRATELGLLIAAHKHIDGEFRARAADLRAELSINATLAAKPAHQAAVAAVLNALVALRAAVAAEVAVRTKLTAAGYDAMLPNLTADVPTGEVPGYDVSPWEQRARAYAA